MAADQDVRADGGAKLDVRPGAKPRWGMVIDLDRCIGCWTCAFACKQENNEPVGLWWNTILTNGGGEMDAPAGEYPDLRLAYQPINCFQCADPPCVHACPVGATRQRDDGIVITDYDACIGNRACIAACPYNLRVYNWEAPRQAPANEPDYHVGAAEKPPRPRGVVEKCDFCFHRVDAGLEPACIEVCPARCRHFGDLNDPNSSVSRLVREKPTFRVQEIAGTEPAVYYVPPQGGAQSWPELVKAVVPDGFSMPQRALWTWRISAHLWTKSIAAGAFLVWALLSFAGDAFPRDAELAIGFVGALFLMLSGSLLVADLGRPRMFLDVLLKPDWRSWAARGAYLLASFGVVLASFVLAAWLGLSRLAGALLLPGTLLALLVSTYTAFLLRQFRRFELWQCPLLPAHLLIQAVVAGSATLTLLGPISGFSGSVRSRLASLLTAALAAHLFLMVEESFVPHRANRTAHNLTRGRYAPLYWAALLVGAAVPLLAAQVGERVGIVNLTCAAGGLALAGLLCWEHAFIQAGQVFESRGQMEFSLPTAALLPRTMFTVSPVDTPEEQGQASVRTAALG